MDGKRRKPIVEALEPRVMFSADVLGVVADDLLSDPGSQPLLDEARDRVEQQLWGARDAARDDKEDGQSGHKHKSRARGKPQRKKMLKDVGAALALLRQVSVGHGGGLRASSKHT